VIEAAVRSQFQKTDGIVAVIAFGGRRRMKFGFTDGRYTVMTFTAITKYFQVVSKRDNGSTLGCMAGLAQITGSEMIR
jgi:hypothetical protein